MGRIRNLPSPALVISMIALSLAIAGGGYAVASSGSKQERKIVKKTVRKLAPHLSVKHAKRANTTTNSNKLGGSPASSYLVGGGKALFARVEVPNLTGAGQRILRLPGLGMIETDTCNSDAIVFAAQYHNTSGGPEDLWLDEQGGSSQSTSYQSVPSGDTVELKHNSYTNWQHSLLTVGRGLGSAAKTATISVGVAYKYDGSTDSCTYQAQGTVQPGS